MVSGEGFVRNATSIRPESSRASRYALGVATPRLAAVSAYVWTTWKTLNAEGTGVHRWNRRSDRTTEPSTSSRRRSSVGICEPSTNRATKHPDAGRNATTGGPTFASAASVAARASFARSMPSSSVSRPGTRRTNRSPSRVTTKFRFVIPPSSGSISRPPVSQPGTDLAIAQMASSVI